MNIRLSQADQESLHKLCTRNRDVLASATRAGCFYCCAIFEPRDIKNWIDGERFLETGDTYEGVTALCPRCRIDSVIPEANGVTISTELLAAMKAHWF